MKSIAVASYSLATSSALREQLEEAHPDIPVTWNTTAQVMDPGSLEMFLQGHTHAILGREILNEELITRLPDLRVVSKYGVGLDTLDLHALAKAGVLLGWTPGVNRLAVAELALTFMMFALRGLHLATTGLKQNEWKRSKGRQLSEKTVGIIGCGNVGREVVRLLQPFHCQVLAHDIRAEEPDYRQFFKENGVESVSLEALLQRSDLVSIHTPKNSTTVNLIGPAQISSMVQGAVLINVARGGLVDETAVLTALESGKLSAAAFDVFQDEPSQNHSLISHPHFIGTPHIGGATAEAIQAMGEAAIEGLLNPVDPLTLLRYQ